MISIIGVMNLFHRNHSVFCHLVSDCLYVTQACCFLVPSFSGLRWCCLLQAMVLARSVNFQKHRPCSVYLPCPDP